MHILDFVALIKSLIFWMINDVTPSTHCCLFIFTKISFYIVLLPDGSPHPSQSYPGWFWVSACHRDKHLCHNNHRHRDSLQIYTSFAIASQRTFHSTYLSPHCLVLAVYGRIVNNKTFKLKKKKLIFSSRFWHSLYPYNVDLRHSVCYLDALPFCFLPFLYIKM